VAIRISLTEEDEVIEYRWCKMDDFLQMDDFGHLRDKLEMMLANAKR